MHTVWFEVAAIVSDMGVMGPTNIGLWKTLTISPSSSGFNNLVTNKMIYVFADVPHLIMLARNHFINKGFVLNEDILNQSLKNI